MTDKELLEAAARAAKLTIRGDATGKNFWITQDGESIKYWNPLTDDGDALRLAVKLGMETYHADDDGWFAYSSHPTARGIAYAVEPHGTDPYAATRRAIVRAAAQHTARHNVGREWTTTAHSALKNGDHAGCRCGSNPRTC